MPEYDGIRFSYDVAMADVRRIRSLASSFLADGAIGLLNDFENSLENIRSATGQRSQQLVIPDEQPILTVDSTGEYRDSRRPRGRAVYGGLSCIWEIQNADRGRKRQKCFSLTGIASTRLRVWTSDEHELVGHWQFEVGDKTSPGPHFHSSANQGEPNGLFPEWLKVPRLPGLLVTPMDALEFLLGELFQRRWLQTVSTDSDERNGWANSQKSRFDSLLRWQSERVRASNTTPWMTLKKAKPAVDVFGES